MTDIRVLLQKKSSTTSSILTFLQCRNHYITVRNPPPLPSPTNEFEISEKENFSNIAKDIDRRSEKTQTFYLQQILLAIHI